MRRSGGLRVAGALRAPPARNVRGHARGDDPLIVRWTRALPNVSDLLAARRGGPPHADPSDDSFRQLTNLIALPDGRRLDRARYQGEARAGHSTANYEPPRESSHAPRPVTRLFRLTTEDLLARRGMERSARGRARVVERVTHSVTEGDASGPPAQRLRRVRPQFTVPPRDGMTVAPVVAG